MKITHFDNIIQAVFYAAKRRGAYTELVYDGGGDEWGIVYNNCFDVVSRHYYADGERGPGCNEYHFTAHEFIELHCQSLVFKCNRKDGV